MATWPRAWSRPMALRTGETFSALLTQLVPAATAMPRVSIINSKPWPSTNSALTVEHTHAFGPVKAVGRERNQIRSEGLHVEGQPPGTGLGIDIKSDPTLGGDGGDLAHRLQRADVVVGLLHRDENGLVRHGRA